MSEAITPAALETLFTGARTHNGWQDMPVSDETLREIYNLMKWGPTSANCSPARIVFVRSAEGKEKLRPALSSGNLEKTLTAPVTAIVAWDGEFYERLPELFPHGDAKSWFTASPALAGSGTVTTPEEMVASNCTSCNPRSCGDPHCPSTASMAITFSSPARR